MKALKEKIYITLGVFVAIIYPFAIMATMKPNTLKAIIKTVIKSIDYLV